MIFGRDPRDRQTEQLNSALKKQQRQHDDTKRELAQLQHRYQSFAASTMNSTQQSFEQLKAQERHYANAILLLGYGGFFALWSSTAGNMPRTWFGLSGILMGASLLLFIGFELAKTIATSTAYDMEGQPGENGRKISVNEAIDLANTRLGKVNRVWRYVFFPSAGLGLTAGFIVLWFFGAAAMRGEWAYPRGTPTENSRPASAAVRPVADPAHKIETAKPRINKASATN